MVDRVRAVLVIWHQSGSLDILSEIRGGRIVLRGQFLIHRFLMKNYASEEESLPLPNGLLSKLPNGQASELRRASKLQQLSTRFENIKMSEDDKFADFYARLSVIVNGCCNPG